MPAWLCHLLGVAFQVMVRFCHDSAPCCMAGCAGKSSSFRLIPSEDDVREDGWRDMVVSSTSEKPTCIGFSHQALQVVDATFCDLG